MKNRQFGKIKDIEGICFQYVKRKEIHIFKRDRFSWRSIVKRR